MIFDGFGADYEGKWGEGGGTKMREKGERWSECGREGAGVFEGCEGMGEYNYALMLSVGFADKVVCSWLSSCGWALRV